MKHAGVLVAVVAGLVLCGSTAQAASLSRLRHEGRWTTDTKGRVVILHGATHRSAAC